MCNVVLLQKISSLKLPIKEENVWKVEVIKTHLLLYCGSNHREISEIPPLYLALPDLK